jgi:general secretion pathway protein D
MHNWRYNTVMKKIWWVFPLVFVLLFPGPLHGAVSLNFDNVDIAVFLKTMSEITGKSFVISDNVKGTISFVSSKGVPEDKVYDIVLTILKAKGFTAVPGENNILRIFPSQEALRMSGRIFYGTEPVGKKVEGIFTQIIPLSYADVSTILNAVRPFFPKDLLITAYPRTNVLLVNGDWKNISLLLNMVHFLDTAFPTAQSDIHIYNLENADAEEIATTLSNLASSIPAQQKREPKQPQQGTAAFSERFKVVANKETNSIIIISAREDYDKIEAIIKELDTKRKQVLVEALIVEISLNDDQTFGFDWSAIIDTPYDADAVASSNTGLYSESLQTGGLPGLTVGLLNGTLPSVYAILNANKENTNLKILSTPEIVTVDNHEATINISEQIPFLTSSRVDEQNNVIQTYDYKDIGIILKLTPHINENGYVTMEIEQQIKKLVEGTTTLENPSVFKREITSRVTVKNKRTIVIGGLIRNDTTNIEQKIPILGDIPLLGLLFRKQIKQQTRTNLLVFLTPHIITEDMDIEKITQKKRAEQQEFEKSKKSKRSESRK